MNKRFSLVFVSLFLVHLLFGQAYLPLAVEGAHWVIRYDKIESIQPVDDLWEYYSTGDTAIENVNYKKVFRRDLVVTQDGPPFEAEGPYELFGVIRDDSVARKVYAVQFKSANECPENAEYLLFDFSLQIGDTAQLCLVPDFKEFVVEDIVTSDYYGITTHAYQSSGWDEVYEGIGSYFGLFEELFAPLKKSSRMYVYHTFLEFYCRESPCWLFVSTPEKLLSESIQLFPNPATDYIYISDENESITSIAVFNHLGQQVITKSGDLNKIDVSELKPGLYIIGLSTNTSSIQKKIIIE